MSGRRKPSAAAPARRRATTVAPRRAIRGKGAYSIDDTYKRNRKAHKVSRKTEGYEASLGRQLLEGGGSALGGMFGMPGIGRMAGSALSSIVGLGDYEVKENVFMEGRLPQMVNIPKAGGTVIRFQEYLGDVYTSADIVNPDKFTLQSFLINAANSDTFPWLNQIAANYETYSFEGLVFEFRSTSADALNSTNTALGSVMLATQYDVADPVFRSKAEMLNYEYSNSVKPSDNCMHMIECAPSQNVMTELYTLDGSAPSGTDARLYHLGRFCVATVGFQAANVNIGELHVTYQVRLLKPKLYASLGNLGDWYLAQSSNYTNANPIPTFLSQSRGNFNVTNPSGAGTIVLPGSAVIKTYRVEVFWSSVTPVSLVMPILTVANCTLDSLGQVPDNGVTTGKASSYFAITTLGNSKVSSFSFGGAGTLPAATSQVVILRIMQVPQGEFA